MSDNPDQLSAMRGGPGLPSDALADIAHRLLKARRRRERYFDPLLFSNPAWDVLLSLFVAGEEGWEVAVIDGCIASTVPPTTTLRWLAFLQQQGMVVEYADLGDPEQKVVSLTRHAREAIESYLGSLVSLGLVTRPDSHFPLTEED